MDSLSTDEIEAILGFVGVVDRHRAVVHTSTALRELCAGQLLVHADCAGAKLPERHGRTFSLCVDVLRWGCCALGLNVGTGTDSALDKQLGRQCSLQDVQHLRERGPEGMDALIRMNASAYTHFHTDCSGVAGSGVLNWLEGAAEERASSSGSWIAAVRRDCRHWKERRLYGSFYVLLQRADGTVLVEHTEEGEAAKAPPRVLLALGIAQSLGEIVGVGLAGPDPSHPVTQASGGAPPLITCTLLPFRGAVVYDGLITLGSRLPAGVAVVGVQPLRQRLLRLYTHAVDSGTLITSLGQPDTDAEAAAHAKATEAAAAAAAAVAAAAAAAAAAVAAAATSAAPAGGASGGRAAPATPCEFSSRSTAIAAALARAPKEAELAFVFRRHGYSEAENPEHATTVMASHPSFAGGAYVLVGGPTPVPSDELEPTLDETARLLSRAVFESGAGEDHMMHMMIGQGPYAFVGIAPATVSVDCAPLVGPLTQLLEGSGVGVSYYPPPSEEEQHASQMQPPASVQEAGCGVCGRQTRADGKPGKLLRCSRCKSVVYCCKEHQLAHWKRGGHKHECRANNI